MNDLTHSAFPSPVPAVVGGATIQTVSGRRLHEALGNRDKYATWFADRVRQYDFVDGTDFVSFSELPEKGGRPRIEHAISLDMAKELCMVERNDAGKAARRYYIECERRASDAIAPPHFRARIDVAREMRLTMNLNLKMARMAGLDGNQALLSANRATEAMTGVNALGLMGISYMAAPQNDVLLTPTEVGRRTAIGSARVVNARLCLMGMQRQYRDRKGHIYYEPTESGVAAGGTMIDTGKKHSDGSPVRQLRWSSSIIDRLRDQAA